MSEEQFTALLAKLKDDSGLREKLQGAADIDAALALAKDAGFDVSKPEWLRHQASQTLELSDTELEGAAGGFMSGHSCSPMTAVCLCGATMDLPNCVA